MDAEEEKLHREHRGNGTENTENFAKGIKTRPRSVTIVSWTFIVFGGLALVVGLLPRVDEAAGLRMAEFRSKYPVQSVLLYVSPVLAVLCGVFMLRGRNWARWVFVIWFGQNIIGSIWRSPVVNFLPGALFFFAVYLLFRPRATRFFRSQSAETSTAPQSA
jgi:hypothetical protein